MTVQYFCVLYWPAGGSVSYGRLCLCTVVLRGGCWWAVGKLWHLRVSWNKHYVHIERLHKCWFSRPFFFFFSGCLDKFYISGNTEIYTQRCPRLVLVNHTRWKNYWLYCSQSLFEHSNPQPLWNWMKKHLCFCCRVSNVADGHKAELCSCCLTVRWRRESDRENKQYTRHFMYSPPLVFS